MGWFPAVVALTGALCVVGFFLAPLRAAFTSAAAALGVGVLAYPLAMFLGEDPQPSFLYACWTAEWVFLYLAIDLGKRQNKIEQAQLEFELEAQREAAKHRQRSMEEMRDYWRQD